MKLPHPDPIREVTLPCGCIAATDGNGVPECENETHALINSENAFRDSQSLLLTEKGELRAALKEVFRLSREGCFSRKRSERDKALAEINRLTEKFQ